MINYLYILNTLKILYIMELSNIIWENKDWWNSPEIRDCQLNLEERYEDTLLDLVRLFDDELS